jgi:FtsP/CotA-like multicopper oxidase with cupredoxin domain
MVRIRSPIVFTAVVALLMLGLAAPAVFAQIPGGTLDPASVPKYQTPMLIPPVMPKAGTIKQTGGKNIDYYEISVRQFNQRILPAGLPATPVWGYGAVSAESKRGLLLHNAPSLTIEADWRRPVRVKWINELVEDPVECAAATNPTEDSNCNYLPHLLPVDPTLHWANPEKHVCMDGEERTDCRPDYTSNGGTPGRYTGPVPMVTHVHGAVGVGDESDGYTEAWYLPDANDIPAGYATEGTWYDFFAGKAFSKFGETWGPGFATFQYPNLGRASTDWYHDHTLGMTRVNVYAGPAGFYIIRGGPDGDSAVLDSRDGTLAVLPGPAPKANDKFPPNKTYYEIPIAIQDRSFNEDGSLFYPDSREFFDGILGDYIPDGPFSPIWNPEFFGNMMMVNGNTWPYQTVEQRRYRFRFLNGCQSRFLILDFSQIPGVEVWAIGNEGGFLADPVNITANHNNQLLMGLAERADLIVDFTNVTVGNYVLGNVGPDEPFKGFNPDGSLSDGEGGALDPADPGSTGKIMQFQVVTAVAADPTTAPQFLVLPAAVPLPPETVTRRLALIEEVGFATYPPGQEGPVEALLGTVNGSGEWTKKFWADDITENPAVGATEVWEIYNTTADAHPMHVHEVAFEVVNRQAIDVNEGDETVQVVPGSVTLPEPWETGRKDTVTAYPGQVTRIRAQFNTPGQYVWHCHIVEHEDNEMMRPYRVGPEQPGQPGS